MLLVICGTADILDKENEVHFQFLIEDISGKNLICRVMEKIQAEVGEFTYDCKSFKGIGGLKLGGNASQIKTDKLLNDLPLFLKAFDKSLQGIDAAIIIVLDNDKRDTQEFKMQLEAVADAAEIAIDHVFCIAVEEMEAWLLGDSKALLAAYPNAREAVLKEYVQDSICGTWEVLANAVYKGGIKRFKKDCPTFREIGKYKSEWADKIGLYLNLKENNSPSFQYLLNAIYSRIVYSAN